jgi:hypothetical protein
VKFQGCGIHEMQRGARTQRFLENFRFFPEKNFLKEDDRKMEKISSVFPS